jgi:hypothetical protein
VDVLEVPIAAFDKMSNGVKFIFMGVVVLSQFTDVTYYIQMDLGVIFFPSYAFSA